MTVHRIGSLVVFVLLCAAPAYAQAPGAMCGTVTDPTGARLTAVTVSLHDSDAPTAPLIAKTDTEGNYKCPVVPVGTYTLSFEINGFKKTVQPNLVMKAGLTLRADQRMEPASAAEEIMIHPAPPVGMTNTRTGATFTKTTLENTPSGRVMPSCGPSK